MQLSVRSCHALRIASICAGISLLGLSCADDAPTGAGGRGGGGAGGSLIEEQGCDETRLLVNPDDTSLPGPWPVGAKTVSIDGLTVEIWYPAKPGSGADPANKEYDLRQWLPESERAKIPDDKAPTQSCDCVADLPLDEARGPYPAIVFVHGTAGFRAQSLEITTHWASRGFVVVAADHPGLSLHDLLAGFCGGQAGTRDLDADLTKLVTAIRSPGGELAFLAGHVDSGRIGMSGHSAGGGAIANQGDVARVLVPMAAGGSEAGSALESTLVLGALEDQVVDYTQTMQGFDGSPSPKRLVGLSPAGHLTFSSLCAITNPEGKDIVSVGEEFGICGLQFAGALFDCDTSYLPAEQGWSITKEASSAVFEEVLQCKSERAKVFEGLQGRHPEVFEVIETP